MRKTGYGSEGCILAFSSLNNFWIKCRICGGDKKVKNMVARTLGWETDMLSIVRLARDKKDRKKKVCERETQWPESSVDHLREGSNLRLSRVHEVQ